MTTTVATSVPLVFLPGWGFDARVLTLASTWPSRALVGNAAHPDRFAGQLAAQLDAAKLDRVDLCGWSLGARLALDFYRAEPDRVRRILLVSLRPAFSADDIAHEHAALERSPRDCLAAFYRRAFVGQKADAERFARLQEEYLAELDAERVAELHSGLDYLAARTITAAELAASAAQLFHGGRDLIAPIAELQTCLQEFPAAKSLHIEPRVGHAAIVTAEFGHWLTAVTSG